MTRSKIIANLHGEFLEAVRQRLFQMRVIRENVVHSSNQEMGFATTHHEHHTMKDVWQSFGFINTVLPSGWFEELLTRMSVGEFIANAYMS